MLQQDSKQVGGGAECGTDHRGQIRPQAERLAAEHRGRDDASGLCAGRRGWARACPAAGGGRPDNGTNRRPRFPFHDLLGFHLGRDSDLRQVGLLYYVLASSNVLGESLQRAERYSALNNEGIALRIRGQRATAMAFHYVGIERQSDRHQIEYLLTAVIRICRQVTNLDLRPRHVRMVHRRREASPELNAFLGCEVAFGSDADEIVFSENVAELPVVSGDPHLNSLLVKFCEEALSERAAARGSLRRDLENAIALLLPHGKAQADEVAARLGMSRRTLGRRLASEDLTFASVLTDLRVDLAKRQLQDGNLAISQIAWLLGYREVSAFTHAFKRWTGKTPREVRTAA